MLKKRISTFLSEQAFFFQFHLALLSSIRSATPAWEVKGRENLCSLYCCHHQGL